MDETFELLLLVSMLHPGLEGLDLVANKLNLISHSFIVLKVDSLYNYSLSCAVILFKCLLFQLIFLNPELLDLYLAVGNIFFKFLLLLPGLLIPLLLDFRFRLGSSLLKGFLGLSIPLGWLLTLSFANDISTIIIIFHVITRNHIRLLIKVRNPRDTYLTGGNFYSSYSAKLFSSAEVTVWEVVGEADSVIV